jgi:hypothetical protein
MEENVLYFSYLKTDGGEYLNVTRLVTKKDHSIIGFNEWLAKVVNYKQGSVVVNCKIIY